MTELEKEVIRLLEELHKPLDKATAKVFKAINGGEDEA